MKLTKQYKSTIIEKIKTKQNKKIVILTTKFLTLVVAVREDMKCS